MTFACFLACVCVVCQLVYPLTHPACLPTQVTQRAGEKQRETHAALVDVPGPPLSKPPNA